MFIKDEVTLTEIFIPVLPFLSTHKIKRFMKYELWQPEYNCFKNSLFFPVKCLLIITVPYETNPLLLNSFEYMVIFWGFFIFFLVNLDLLNAHWWISIILGMGVTAMHRFLKIFRCYRRSEHLVLNIFCLFICSILIFGASQFLKDLILFAAFQLE